MMSVDVFGRQLSKRAKNSQSQRGPPGIGFRLTSNGQYDIANKRLCNIGNAVEESDAISMKNMNTALQQQAHVTNTNLNVLKNKITNLAEKFVLQKVQSEQILSKFNDDIIKSVEYQKTNARDHQQMLHANVAELQNLIERNHKLILKVGNQLTRLEGSEYRLTALEGRE